MTGTRGKVIATIISVYELFLVFSEPIVAGIYYVVVGSLPGLDVESTFEPQAGTAFAIPD